MNTQPSLWDIKLDKNVKIDENVKYNVTVNGEKKTLYHHRTTDSRKKIPASYYKNMSDSDLISAIVDLVWESTRKMPAHFTSTEERTQSFCVNFEDINPDDEYQMASASWYWVGQYMEQGNNFTKEQSMTIIHCGEDLMISSYIIEKIKRNEILDKVALLLTEANEKKWSAERNTAQVFSTKSAKDWFKFCKQYGVQVAQGSRIPPNIKVADKSREEIEALYHKKIEILLNGRDEKDLIEKELGIFNRLQNAKQFDPRHKDIYFGLKEEAVIGTKIAEKLNSMTDEEFLASSYPYEWLDELKQKTICQVLNKDVLKVVENDVKDENKTNNVNILSKTGFTSPTEIVEIIKGDITELAVDAIVNSAHPTLLAGSGVCGAIHRAAGKELEKECKTIAGDHFPGQLALTQGYNLKARYVLHVIVPHAKKHGKLSVSEREILINCYKEAIYTANRCGMKSMAFPSLGTGVRGYPIKEMSELAVKTVIDYLGEFHPEAFLRVCFVAHSEEDYIAYQNAYKKYLQS